MVEVVDPIILNTKVREADDPCCRCCCCCDDVPSGIASSLNGTLNDTQGRYLTVSLGVFSVVRIVRPAQYLIQGTEYCVPDKECVGTEEDDPCAIFRTMAFPSSEFCPTGLNSAKHELNGGKCGCRD